MKTPAVLAALQKAKDAGVPFADSYQSPYSVRTVSTDGKDTAYDFDLPDYYRRDKSGYVTHYEEDTARIRAVKQLHCVDFAERGRRFGPFYITKAEADHHAECLNIRHFEVAAMSDNPKHPVLL